MSSLLTWSTYIIVFGALGVLAVRDRAKAKQAVKVAIKSFFGILPIMLAMIGLIGLMLGLVPPAVISRYVGEGAGWWATVTAFLLGALLYIASLVSIPLAASLLRAGASITTIAAFLTGLMMVNTVTLPLEIKHLGKKMALGRNLLSLLFAFLIAIIMGIVLQ
jgi:uncharacterized membrane protein YraQ (UPF0718 family)